jgi:hypothetical protein
MKIRPHINPVNNWVRSAVTTIQYKPTDGVGITSAGLAGIAGTIKTGAGV